MRRFLLRFLLFAKTSASRILAAFAAITSVAGCASYDAQPLPQRSNLQAGLEGLDTTIPAAFDHGASRRIDTAWPLGIHDVGLLAVLNDPDLKSEQGEIDVARAGVLQAAILPNPTASYSYGHLISGPRVISSNAASLAEEIVPIITRGARVKSAQARLRQVDADQLWREWQVAQKAQQLALDIAFADRLVALSERQRDRLREATTQARKAVAARNLTVRIQLIVRNCRFLSALDILMVLPHFLLRS